MYRRKCIEMEAFTEGHTAISGTQQPNFIHGKAFKEPADRVSGREIDCILRLCQSPEACSVLAPVLNLMLCLSHWTWGHSKVKLELQMIKKWNAQKKRKVNHLMCFPTRLPWQSLGSTWQSFGVLSKKPCLSVDMGLQKGTERQKIETFSILDFSP